MGSSSAKLFTTTSSPASFTLTDSERSAGLLCPGPGARTCPAETSPPSTLAISLRLSIAGRRPSERNIVVHHFDVAGAGRWRDLRHNGVTIPTDDFEQRLFNQAKLGMPIRCRFQRHDRQRARR